MGATWRLKPVTKTIYGPNDVFASAESLLTTLVVGDQIFVNARLLGTTVVAREGTLLGSKLARYMSEIMAVEAVHRAPCACAAVSGQARQ